MPIKSYEVMPMKNTYPEFRFSVGENVLCHHGIVLYRAKCLERCRAPISNKPLYFIHYRNWKSTHDEWVDHDRLLKINDENIALMAHLNSIFGK